jgi:hypothetical protein
MSLRLNTDVYLLQYGFMVADLLGERSVSIKVPKPTVLTMMLIQSNLGIYNGSNRKSYLIDY